MKNKLLKKTPYNLRRAVSRIVFGRSKKNNIYKSHIDYTKAIYIHIPKAAGKSIAIAVYGDDKPGHYSIKDYKFFDKTTFNNAFKFTFVRNPVDRFVSAYNYLSTGGNNNGDLDFLPTIKKYKDINDFVENWANSVSIWSKEHFVPQYYFTMINDRNELDFIGKVENIEKDYRIVQATINTPDVTHTNQSKKNKTALTGKSINKIAALYKKDFKVFDYELP